MSEFMANDLKKKIEMLCVTKENLCKYATLIDVNLPDMRMCELKQEGFPYRCTVFEK